MGHGHGGGGGGGAVTGGQARKARYAVMQHYQAMMQDLAPGDPGFELAIGDFFHPGNKIMGIAIPFIVIKGSASTSSSLKLAENVNRRYLLIQNVDSGSDDLRVGFDADADGNSLLLEPGGWYEPIMVPTSAIHLEGDGGTATFVIIHG